MITKRTLRRWVILITLGYLLPALACNFPFPTNRSDALGELPTTLTALAKSASFEQTPVPIGEEATSSSPAEVEITATPPGPSQPPLQTPGQIGSGSHFIYFTQNGDTLPAVAKRFGVEPEQIDSSRPIEPEALLLPGTELLIPNALGEINLSDFLLPDSEIIHSPSTTDFQVGEFIKICCLANS